MSIAQQNQIHVLETALAVLEVRVTKLERALEEFRPSNKDGRIVMKNGHAEITTK